MRAQEFIFENNDDGESGNLKSIDLARQNIGRILSAAQRIYDNWDESDRDTYAGGGICHIIADAICDVMWNIGIECTTVSCSYEQHVYVAVKVEEGVYTIDIPYSIYETGGGFNWQKNPDIKFDTRDVVFYKVSGDPEEFENYTALEESQQDVAENFADGKKPGRKGLAKRMGVPTKASVSRLRQIAKSSSGEKARMAHWMANMKAGKAKKS